MSQYNDRGGLGREWWAVMGVVGTLVVVCAIGALIYYLNISPSQASLPTDIDALVANAAATTAARVTPASAPLVFTLAPVTDLSATLSEITGKVEFKQAGDGVFSPAHIGTQLKSGGQIQTGPDGKVRLDLSSGTIIRVTPSSIFTLTANEKADKGLATRLKLDIGWIFIVLSGGSVDVETPAGVAAVHGSYLSVRYDPVSGNVSLTCLEGSCSATNSGSIINFTNGQSVIFSRNNAGQWSTRGVTAMTDNDYRNWLAFGLNSPPPGSIGLTIQGLGTTNGQFLFSVVITAGQTASAGGVCELTTGAGINNSSTTLQVISGASGFPNLSNQGCRVSHNPAPSSSTICFASINNTSTIYFNNNGFWAPLNTIISGGKACTSGNPNPAGEYRIGITP